MKKKTSAISEVRHEISNCLGVARGRCELFLLNLRDGLYDTKTKNELSEMAAEIMHSVITETDRVMKIIRKKESGKAKTTRRR